MRLRNPLWAIAVAWARIGRRKTFAIDLDSLPDFRRPAGGKGQAAQQCRKQQDQAEAGLPEISLIRRRVLA